MPLGVRSLLHLRVWLARRVHPNENHALLAWAAGVGVLGGLLSLLFRALLVPLQYVFTGQTGGLVAAAAALPWWARLLAPALGGICAGGVLTWAALARGHTDKPAKDFMEAIVVGDGRMPPGPILTRSLSALLSIASGAAIGREGPMVQLSAMAASLLGRSFRLSAPRLRLLVACGVAAGIASAYRAPVAGALFVAEVVLGSITSQSFGPLLCASVAATLTVRYGAEAGPLYPVGPLTPGAPWELLAYGVLGLGAGVMGPAFLLALAQTRAAFGRLSSRPMVRLGAGGLVVGALSVVWPEVWGNGYSVVVQLLHRPGPLPVIGLVLCAKMVAVLAAVGSGAVGGVFTPTLFMGATLGALFSRVLHLAYSDVVPQNAAYALVGMGAMLAATTHAPYMAIVMIFEMTGDYDMVLPLTIACLVARALASRLRPASIYTEDLGANDNTPQPKVLVPLVLAAMEQVTSEVTLLTSFGKIASAFARLGTQTLYVVDHAHVLHGAIQLPDVADVLREPFPRDLVVACDIMHQVPNVLRTTMPLWQAAALFTEVDEEQLPVCDDGPTPRLVGTLSRADVALVLAHGTDAFRVR